MAGWTEPSGSRTALGALVLGVHDDGGRLVHAGRVGTGFTDRTLRELHERLEKLGRRTSPLADPPRGSAARDIHRVEPELVAEVAFTEWTKDGSVRHPSSKYGSAAAGAWGPVVDDERRPAVDHEADAPFGGHGLS